MILCIYAASSAEARERWTSHIHDTEAQLDYTLCLSAAITCFVDTASQRWTEASHFCDISSRLDVNESLIEMQTHGLSSCITWECVYACLKSVASSLCRGLVSSTRSYLNTFNTLFRSLFRSFTLGVRHLKSRGLFWRGVLLIFWVIELTIFVFWTIDLLWRRHLCHVFKPKWQKDLMVGSWIRIYTM